MTVIVVSFVLCNVRGQFESWEGGYLGKTWYVAWLYSMPICGYSLLARNVWKDNAEWNPFSIIAERSMRNGGESGDCGEERLLPSSSSSPPPPPLLRAWTWIYLLYFNFPVNKNRIKSAQRQLLQQLAKGQMIMHATTDNSPCRYVAHSVSFVHSRIHSLAPQRSPPQTHIISPLWIMPKAHPITRQR